MDLSFLAFLTVNNGECNKVEKVRLGDKYFGEKLSAIHVHPYASISEGFMFIDQKTGRGIFRNWYPSGKEHFVFEILNGQNEGNYCELYESGIVKVRGYIENGKIIGPYFRYYPDGTLQCTVQYRDGELYGICRYYYEDGTLRQEDDHLNDITFKRKIFYPTGIMSENYKMLDGKPIEKHTKYYPNGAVSYLAVYSAQHRLILKRVYKERGLTY